MATNARANAHPYLLIRAGFSVLIGLLLAAAVHAQTATYRLHREASTTANLFQLKTANPDAASLAIQSANLKSVATGEYIIKAFDTQAGVPNASGVIPAGSTVTFSLWMVKTASAGTMFPRVKLNVNSAAGASICTITGATALTTTLTKYTLTGTVPTTVSMTTSDRFYLWVGVNLTAPTSVNNRAELDVEGTVNGNFDSLITVPLPVNMGTIAGTITRSSDGAPLSAALVEALQGGVVKGSTTTAANGAFTMSSVIVGTYDVRASAIGYQTKVQNNVTVSANTTTTVNQSLDAVTPGDISYIYDESGRLVSVVSPTETVTYTYDAAGNLLSTTRQNSNLPAILEFTPNSGLVGAQVIIYGTNFSSTLEQNTVKFNGVTATVASVTPTQIVTTVPPGATTGPITVNTPTGLATSGTSFTVVASAAPTITSFTPTIGAAGTAVTITGTNFDTTASNNRVTFNNTFAQINSVSPTSIATVAPNGGTSGHISVTTPNGKAVSTADFFIPPSPYVASDVQVTGRIAYGGSQTVAITTSAKIGLIVFDAEAGQRVSLKVNTSTFASCLLRIYNPNGTTLASSTANTNGGFMDTPLLPTTGTYTILVDPDSTNTGSINFTLNNASDVTTTITPGGAAVTATTTVQGQNARLTFNGTGGQRISLKMTGVNIGTSSCCSTFVSIVSPDGTTLVAPTFVGTSGGFIDVQTLSATGSYTILVDPQGTDTGSITLTLYDVPADPTPSITAGGAAVTVTTTVPGQNAKPTFNGTAGQRISLTMSSVSIGTSSCCSTRVSILNPDGSTLLSPAFVGTSGGFIDTQTLPATGAYTILVDPQSSDTGSMTLTLNDVPADITGTITPGGAPVTITTTISGQNAGLTFNGNTSQRISLKMTSVTIGTSSCCSTRVSILNPDGSTLVSPVFVGTSGGFIDVQTLPATGVYKIFIDPQSTDTGSMTLTLYDVPADINTSITPGGADVTVTTTVPGQNAKATFSGTSGQRVSLKMTGVTIGTSSCCSTRVSILNPDGSTLVSPTFVGTSGAFIDVQTLSATGNYTILVDPQSTDTGSMTLSLYDVPADSTTSITPGGAAVTVTTTVPGQNTKATFSGTSGQRISLRMTGVTIGTSSCCSTRVSILKPDGITLVAPTFIGTSGGFIDVQTLSATGTYTILVDPQSSDTGSMTLTLYDVPADTTGTVTIGGAAVNVTTTTPSQNARLTFSGTSGQQATVHVTSNTMGLVRVTLLKPDGSSLTSTFTSAGSFNLATQTLPVSGTYTITIDPDSFNIGSMNVSVTNP